MIGLGIDAGGSSTRWLLRDGSGKDLGSGRTGPITGHVFTPDDLATMRERLRSLLAEVTKIARPDAVVAGITGFHGGSEASREIERTVREVLQLPEKRVSLVDDIRIAYASVFEPGEGVLVYAGTGSVAYHVTAGGESLRAGGHGYLIDDAGAGYWIGHEGLKQTMRWADEGDGPDDRALSQEIYSALDSFTWDDIVVDIYGGGRQRVASLAPAVARAAERGDEAANGILEQAGQELARLAAILHTRIGRTLPVAFAGGISRLSPVLSESLRRRLPADTPLEQARVEPVSAAVRLAVDLAR